VTLAATLAVHVAGLALTVPHGWHVDRSRTDCDPVQLLVVSSAPVRTRVRNDGTLAGAPPGAVEIFLFENHLNDPRTESPRPRHFAWKPPHRLEGCCGTPSAPGAIYWFRFRGRLLGYMVYVGRGVTPQRRAQTLRLLDSLR
jgi:hypothetical protein